MSALSAQQRGKQQKESEKKTKEQDMSTQQRGNTFLNRDLGQSVQDVFAFTDATEGMNSEQKLEWIASQENKI